MVLNNKMQNIDHKKLQKETTLDYKPSASPSDKEIYKAQLPLMASTQTCAPFLATPNSTANSNSGPMYNKKHKSAMQDPK